MARRILVTERLLSALLVGLAIASTALLQSASAESDAAPAARDEPVVESRPGTGAHMIYIDPQTGRPGTPPESEPDSTPKLNARSAAPALVEEPLPSGGFKVDTQGHFDEPLKATVDGEGNLVIHHGEQP